VIEIGDAVARVKLGDIVCLPFNISCGFCKNCERELTGFCLTLNSGTAGAAYGYAGMGRSVYLHYEVTSLLARFVDDVEILFDDATKSIHFRLDDQG
jgi:threonine dehydrogenase-like Zn-dependent dehydrogenase